MGLPQIRIGNLGRPPCRSSLTSIRSLSAWPTSRRAGISRAKPRRATSHQNLVGAFADNSLGLPVALGILYPFIGLLLSPILAALAMSFSSVTVITNANRLKRFELKEVAA